MDAESNEYANRSVMVTDLMERTDDISIGLLEYFDKNFDVKLSEVKKKYAHRKRERCI